LLLCGLLFLVHQSMEVTRICVVLNFEKFLHLTPGRHKDRLSDSRCFWTIEFICGFAVRRTSRSEADRICRSGHTFFLLCVTSCSSVGMSVTLLCSSVWQFFTELCDNVQSDLTVRLHKVALRSDCIKWPYGPTA